VDNTVATHDDVTSLREVPVSTLIVTGAPPAARCLQDAAA
jgi:hypothetical protein